MGSRLRGNDEGNTAGEIAGDTDVECAVFAARENINPISHSFAVPLMGPGNKSRDDNGGAGVKISYPRPLPLPYSPRHPFPLLGRAADRLFSWKGCGACGERPNGPVAPGVPSRTRGYYGPRAGELVGSFELRYRLSPT